mgnify:CR=1 FL=1
MSRARGLIVPTLPRGNATVAAPAAGGQPTPAAMAAEPLPCGAWPSVWSAERAAAASRDFEIGRASCRERV